MYCLRNPFRSAASSTPLKAVWESGLYLVRESRERKSAAEELLLSSSLRNMRARYSSAPELSQSGSELMISAYREGCSRFAGRKGYFSRADTSAKIKMLVRLQECTKEIAERRTELRSFRRNEVSEIFEVSSLISPELEEGHHKRFLWNRIFWCVGICIIHFLFHGGRWRLMSEEKEFHKETWSSFFVRLNHVVWRRPLFITINNPIIPIRSVAGDFRKPCGQTGHCESSM